MHQIAGGTSGPAVETAGIHAFLIADVRGYTTFTFDRGDEAAARLAARFAEVAVEVVSAHGGEVTELRGDEALAVFGSTREALRAAVALQARLATETSDDLPLRAGIGLDAGEAVRVRDGYRGGALNIAARLCSLAGPGEIFVTPSVLHLANRVDGIEVRDRGPVTLKGVPYELHVMQVARPQTLPGELPPLQQAIAARPSNLPDPATPLVGREEEIATLSALLQNPHIRLVTLTGPGGTGKTRLALEVGLALLYDYPDGVFFVTLASVTDPGLVLSSIARALGVQESADQPLFDTLRLFLQDRHLLLVLDNLEHLPDAVPEVGALLDACRMLNVLVTSRTVLHLTREHEFRVEPLPIAPSTEGLTPQDLLRFDAIRFFVERAQAVKPQFTLDASNGVAVAELCARLDGLPLALELAAARIRLFPLPALLKRLTRRLDLLTGGARDAPGRQQTLRGALDWSYSLLSAPEQRLLARMAVFSGGGDFEAVEAICASTDAGVMDELQVLVEQSLVRESGEDDARYSMLETIREYATERLEASGELEETRAAHAAHFVELAEAGEVGLQGSDQAEWLARLSREHDNLRAALSWSVDHHDEERALRLTGALWRFWWIRAYLREGSGWLQSALAMSPDGFAMARARALAGAGNLAWAQGDYEAAVRFHHAALQLRRRLGDRAGEARSLNSLGAVAETRGDYKEAATLYEQSLEVARATGDLRTYALALGNLGGARISLGQYEEARAACEESLHRWRELGDRVSETRVLNNVVFLLVDQRRFADAAGYQAQSIRLLRETGNTENVAVCLDGAAEILSYLDRPEAAARLWGAAEHLRETLGQLVAPNSADNRAGAIAASRGSMDPIAFDAAWATGRAMSPSAAQDYALEELEGPGSPEPDPS